jgi:hypothetical protein
VLELQPGVIEFSAEKFVERHLAPVSSLRSSMEKASGRSLFQELRPILARDFKR